MSTKSGPISGVLPGQVQVVLDDHDGAGGQVVSDAAGGGRQDDGAAPGGDAGAQRVDHLDGRQALVEVAATAQDEDPEAVVVDRPGPGPVPAGRIGREEGQRVERDGALAGTQDLGGAREPAARAAPGRRGGRSRAGGPVPGRCAPPGRRRPPWGDRRGSRRVAARNISPTCPRRPPPPPSTRSHPLTGTRSSPPARSSLPAAVPTCPASSCASPTSVCAIPRRKWCAPSTPVEDVVVDRRLRLVLLQGPEADRGRGRSSR